MDKREYYVDYSSDNGYGVYYDVIHKPEGYNEQVKVVPLNFPDKEDAEVFRRLMNFGLKLKD